jgi:hypothetical protein
VREASYPADITRACWNSSNSRTVLTMPIFSFCWPYTVRPRSSAVEQIPHGVGHGTRVLEDGSVPEHIVPGSATMTSTAGACRWPGPGK